MYISKSNLQEDSTLRISKNKTKQNKRQPQYKDLQQMAMAENYAENGLSEWQT